MDTKLNACAARPYWPIELTGILDILNLSIAASTTRSCKLAVGEGRPGRGMACHYFYSCHTGVRFPQLSTPPALIRFGAESPPSSCALFIPAIGAPLLPAAAAADSRAFYTRRRHLNNTALPPTQQTFNIDGCSNRPGRLKNGGQVGCD